MKKRNIYLISLTSALLVLVGTLFLSRNATPQNRLYFIRLNVVEKIQEYTKTSDMAKANYALQLGEQRLQELQVLKEQDLLETETAYMVRNNFNEQTILVQSKIIDLSTKENIETRDIQQLAESLDVQIERAKFIFDLDQLEVLPEGAPIPKETNSKTK